MRNWLTAFRPASFSGVPFKVELEEVQGARRLSISPLAYSDQSVVEDMGGELQLPRVTAYCAGDSADAEAIALTAVLQAGGPGLLILPMMPPVLVRVSTWSLRRDKNMGGHVALDIDFVPAGLSSVPFSSGGLGQLVDLVKSGTALFRGAFG